MSELANEAFRQRSLQTLASTMVQINATTLARAGSPNYDTDGNIVGVGSFRIPNPMPYYDYLVAKNSGSA